MEKNFLTEAQTAKVLSLSVKCLQKWRHSGVGPKHVKFGRAVRYSISDLHDYIVSCRVKSIYEDNKNDQDMKYI